MRKVKILLEVDSRQVTCRNERSDHLLVRRDEQCRSEINVSWLYVVDFFLQHVLRLTVMPIEISGDFFTDIMEFGLGLKCL